MQVIGSAYLPIHVLTKAILAQILSCYLHSDLKNVLFPFLIIAEMKNVGKISRTSSITFATRFNKLNLFALSFSSI